MRYAALPLLLAGLLALTGCESTFDKAERAREAAGTIEQVTSADITQAAGITAEAEGVIASSDGFTAAVVVKITTQPGAALLWPQIQIDVLDASGQVIGTNNIPGALPTLIHVPSAPAGATSMYVNDQILISGVPASAKVVIDGQPYAGELPKPLEATAPTIVDDPSLGKAWTTTVTNTTGVRQEEVIVQVAVRKNGKVVGAGTALIQGGLDPGAKADVTGYFIGSADGDLEITVPASNAADGQGAPAEGAPQPAATTTAPTSTGGVTAPANTLQIG